MCSANAFKRRLSDFRNVNVICRGFILGSRSQKRTRTANFNLLNLITINLNTLQRHFERCSTKDLRQTNHVEIIHICINIKHWEGNKRRNNKSAIRSTNEYNLRTISFIFLLLSFPSYVTGNVGVTQQHFQVFPCTQRPLKRINMCMCSFSDQATYDFKSKSDHLTSLKHQLT